MQKRTKRDLIISGWICALGLALCFIGTFVWIMTAPSMQVTLDVNAFKEAWPELFAITFLLGLSILGFTLHMKQIYKKRLT